MDLAANEKSVHADFLNGKSLIYSSSLQTARYYILFTQSFSTYLCLRLIGCRASQLKASVSFQCLSGLFLTGLIAGRSLSWAGLGGMSQAQDESIMLHFSGAMSFHVLAKFIVVYAEMLQLLGNFVPETPYMDPAGVLCPPD